MSKINVLFLFFFFNIGLVTAQNLVINPSFENTANGFFSLQQNLTGSNNTANGSNSLLNNTIGTNNTASGSSSLQQPLLLRVAM
jgi:hypothetical protein